MAADFHAVGINEDGIAHPDRVAARTERYGQRHVIYVGDALFHNVGAGGTEAVLTGHEYFAVSLLKPSGVVVSAGLHALSISRGGALSHQLP